MQKTERFIFVLDKEMADDLRAIARDRGLTTSALARAILGDFLRANAGRTYSRVKHGGRRERVSPAAAEKNKRASSNL